MNDQHLSALAAIEKYRQIVIGRREVELNATDRMVYGCDLTQKDYDNFVAIKPDLSLLHEHDADVRKPLVDALEWIVENGEQGTSIVTKAMDALWEVKQQ